MVGAHPARAPPGRRLKVSPPTIIKAGPYYYKGETDLSRDRSTRLFARAAAPNSMGIIAYLYIAGGTAAPGYIEIGYGWPANSGGACS